MVFKKMNQLREEFNQDIFKVDDLLKALEGKIDNKAILLKILIELDNLGKIFYDNKREEAQIM